MNKMYGFEGEVKAKYSANMVDLFTEVYNWLPLAHNINNKILVMHGGLFSKVRHTVNVRNPNVRISDNAEIQTFLCSVHCSDFGRSGPGVGVRFKIRLV